MIIEVFISQILKSSNRGHSFISCEQHASFSNSAFEIKMILLVILFKHMFCWNTKRYDLNFVWMYFLIDSSFSHSYSHIVYLWKSFSPPVGFFRCNISSVFLRFLASIFTSSLSSLTLCFSVSILFYIFFFCIHYHVGPFTSLSRT